MADRTVGIACWKLVRVLPYQAFKTQRVEPRERVKSPPARRLYFPSLLLRRLSSTASLG